MRREEGELTGSFAFVSTDSGDRRYIVQTRVDLLGAGGRREGGDRERVVLWAELRGGDGTAGTMRLRGCIALSTALHFQFGRRKHTTTDSVLHRRKEKAKGATQRAKTKERRSEGGAAG